MRIRSAESTDHRHLREHNKDATTTPSSTDERAVRDLYQQLMEAWNQGSGAAFASVFTEDGDLVGFDGAHLRGRDEIAPFHQQLFDKWLKGSRVGKVQDMRFLAPDVAVMHALGGTIMRGKSKPSPGRDSIQTLVATKHAGESHFAASRTPGFGSSAEAAVRSSPLHCRT
jgi:uncharacterized protein (TIGR02246 family)